MGFERSVRTCAAVLATGGFIDTDPPKVNGAVDNTAMDETNSHAMAAMLAMINFPSKPLEAQGSEYVEVPSYMCFREPQREFLLLIAPAWIRYFPEVCASCV